jgi:ribosomal protein L20
MPRAKRGNKRTEKRKRILDLAKGYRGTKSKLYRSAKESVERGLKFAYTGRKLKKRDFRSLWIVRAGRERAHRHREPAAGRGLSPNEEGRMRGLSHEFRSG